MPGRSDSQCLQRWSKSLKPGLTKGRWTIEEDRALIQLVQTNTGGSTKWSDLAKRIPGRTSKQCRERWFSHLDPNLKHGPFSPEEDQVILEQHELLGRKWSKIAQQLPGRTIDAVRIRFRSLTRQAQKKNSTAQKAGDSRIRKHDEMPKGLEVFSDPSQQGGTRNQRKKTLDPQELLLDVEGKGGDAFMRDLRRLLVDGDDVNSQNKVR